MFKKVKKKMKKKIIVLGLIILLIGIITPQTGAVHELAEQKDVVQDSLEEETYGPYFRGTVYIGYTTLENVKFEKPNGFETLDYEYGLFGIIDGEPWTEEIEGTEYIFIRPKFVICNPSLGGSKFLFKNHELGFEINENNDIPTIFFGKLITHHGLISELRVSN